MMRHGPAEDDSPTGRDADRALTISGRDRVRDVARALVEAGEAPLAILSSPLVRALQTAEIVAAVTKLEGKVEITKEMAPGGDGIRLAADLLRAGRKRVMVVGHEPDLSMLVMRLLGAPPSLGMQKAMVVGAKLALSEDGQVSAAKRFVLDPKTLAWDRS